MRGICLLFFIVCSNALFAQNFDYQFVKLDEALTKNADAVIRLDELEVNVEARNQMRTKTRQVITVLNEAGNKSVNAHAFYDSKDRIEHLQVIVYDALGNEVKKIKKKDFTDTSAVPGGTLYTDSRVKYLHFTPVNYPYTIEFQCEYVTPNTAFIPQWYFLGDYRTSVQKSRYKFTVDPSLSFKYKEYNLAGYPIQVTKSENELLYEAENLPAIKKEAMSPPLREFSPRIRVALNEFHLEGVNGTASNWKDFGKWMHEELLAGRDEVDSQTVTEIRSLVKDVEDPLEKVEIVYDFVQNNTRYISVQLGIGGWMPISAIEVDRVKYGDCKGLTNYTKALLKAVGIESYYTVVYAGNDIRNLDDDIVCIQGNHVILNVPMEGGDAWLECTSQVMPTNYLGNFTDNRKVLRIKPDGGEIIKTPDYSEKRSYISTKSEYNLDASGNISGNSIISSIGSKYYDRFRLGRMPEDRIEKFYMGQWDYVNNLTLSEHHYSNDKAQVKFTESIKIDASEYGTLSGDQLLFSPNVLSRHNRVPKRYRNRTREFVNQRGFVDEAEYIIHLPDGYELSNALENHDIDSDFGTYRLNLEKIDDKTIKYKRYFQLNRWKRPKEEYNNYRNFRKQIARLENSKLVLTKI